MADMRISQFASQLLPSRRSWSKAKPIWRSYSSWSLAVPLGGISVFVVFGFQEFLKLSVAPAPPMD
jgi:hypothetical protein